MDISEKYNLITRNLQEVMGEIQLKKLLEEKEHPVVYLGTAPTGVPSIGYLCPLRKIADFLNAGLEVIILFADLHAFLDSAKSTLDQVKARTKIYEEIIKGTLDALNVDHSKIIFTIGSSFQLSKDYQMDLFKLGNVVTVHNAQKAGAEVVKQNSSPLINGLVYPLMQVLDEEHLGVDIFAGGIDQRKICTLALESLPKLGYRTRVHLLNQIISGLSNVATGGEKVKMSSSEPGTKIGMLDAPKEIQKKVSKAYCKDGDVFDNTPLSLLKELLFPILDDFKRSFIINRPEKYGGKLEYLNYEQVENDFKELKLSPVDLKLGISDVIIELTEFSRKRFETDEMTELLKLGYGSEK
jgi:tyrosyl-tRNA synthetase